MDQLSVMKKNWENFFHELAWWRSSFSASLCFVFFVDVLYTYFHSFAKSRSLLLLLTLLLFWRRDLYFLTRIMTVIKLILLYLLLGQNIEFVCHFFIAREYKGSPSMSLEFSLKWKILKMEMSYLVELKAD